MVTRKSVFAQVLLGFVFALALTGFSFPVCAQQIDLGSSVLQGSGIPDGYASGSTNHNSQEPNVPLAAIASPGGVMCENPALCQAMAD